MGFENIVAWFAESKILTGAIFGALVGAVGSILVGATRAIIKAVKNKKAESKNKK